ncbi:MAG: PAS domain-containing protein [Candidatus Devosia phytovorans]|uniref:histidine kinase n=1 Tax=Candidatus Devosia phytovorans TaxID=3121372 RepID=A0AAJ6AYN9_9HYPH|nr:PAS domain-containing protein [Devosia sp.]WEK03800.1 MAG: PAS domain-containing protein [Devosia sp.]
MVPQAAKRLISAERTIHWDAQRAELRSVAEKSPLMVWMTEPDGYCIYMSQNWYDFTGQEPGEAEGDGWANALHRDDRQQALDVFLNATARGVMYHTEYRLCRHDEEYRWVIAVGHPFFDADGTLGGYVGTDASAEVLVRSRKSDNVLTPRERQVVQWVAGGKTSLEISIIIGIAARTVEQHVQAAMVKLGATNRVQLAVEAAKRGEIEI